MGVIAFRMKLKPGCKDVYKQRHDDLSPEMALLLHQAGIEDYHIFLDEETDFLFAFQRVSGTQSSQQLGDHPIIQRWWKYMADIMDTNPDFSPVCVPLEKVFTLQ